MMDLEETMIVRYFLDRALATLTERERLIITMFYYDNDDLSDIAKHFSRTRERMRQVREKALRRLRHASRSKCLEGAPYWRSWQQPARTFIQTETKHEDHMSWWVNNIMKQRISQNQCPLTGRHEHETG